MMKVLLVMFWVLLSVTASSQLHPFDVSLIPEALKKNAASVIREERIEFEVRSMNKAVQRVHKVVTLLNEGANDALSFQKYTDQFHSLEDVKITVMDARGKQVRSYERKDLSKQADMGELVPDGKIYFLTITPTSYPMTISMDYEIKYNGLLNYPAFMSQRINEAVEEAVYIATVPAALGLRISQHQNAPVPVITKEGKNFVHTWTIKQLPAQEFEPEGSKEMSSHPAIVLAPNRFELDGYEGDMSSWKNFGSWYHSLSRDALDLSPDRKAFFQDLVKTAASDLEKTRIIYNYLQRNFRYVSIQLGIGGFKPFRASFTDKKKYGDCKALSNYTQACLSAVGVRSYQALINRGSNNEPVDPAFPINEFNHVILFVPIGQDSIWLECTSTTNDFAELGTSTENRNALLIMEDGGKLVATPRSKATDHLFSSSSRIVLSEDGSGTADVRMTTTGEFKQEFIWLSTQKADVKKRYLLEHLGFLQPDEFELKQDKDIPAAVALLTMHIEKIPEFRAGTKMFLSPRIHKLWNNGMPGAENRTMDYYFEHPMIKTDTTVYQLPEGYVVETMPKAKEISFEYGSFSSSYQFDQKQRTVTSTARFVLNAYKIPVNKFLSTKKFVNDVLKEYSEKIVVKRL